ncbi:Aspartokinase [Drechslerella dactyloides]|uniref:Homoserine dehydrogenase n=1 Tax=Drechslerella dactyloides TaxID=74499 RepID=A0AAD6NLN5_DREDA|nr:Aspartokinase [Drechslerella dactyloides]
MVSHREHGHRIHSAHSKIMISAPARRESLVKITQPGKASSPAEGRTGGPAYAIGLFQASADAADSADIGQRLQGWPTDSSMISSCRRRQAALSRVLFKVAQRLPTPIAEPLSFWTSTAIARNSFTGINSLHTMTKDIKVAIIALSGVGGVGKAFIAQLDNYIQRNHATISISVVYVARSSAAIISRDYSPLPLTAIVPEKLDAVGGPPLSVPDLIQFLKNSGSEAIVIDNTSSIELARQYPDFLKAGIHIATPNKKGFSSEESLWNDIFAAAGNNTGSGGYVFHESTVGAGLPVISTIKDLIDTGDEVERIEGVFSGTLSFLFNQFAPAGESGAAKAFSEVVKFAKDAGYTEPDPRDDLNGMDVARKLTILARLSGLAIPSPTSFPVQSLIPKPLESASSSQEFMANLPNYDAEMGQLAEEAKKEGKVIRFVGSMDVASKALKVGLEKLDASHPIATLKGSDNVVAFYTKRYGDRALVVQGAGAGADLTAMGVLSDVIKIIERIK